MQNVFHAGFGAFHAGFIEKEGELWYFQGGRIPAFADVTDPDMAKAAQWCTEQGTMAAKGDRFEPEGWTPKFKVIEVWNKAFPAA